MKFLSKTVIAITAFAGLSFSVQADGTAVKTPSNPWTECGLGAMIFPKLPVGAVISNIIWDLGTTAVSSAGSSPETCEGEGYVAAMYITETFVNLEEDTAKGEGQYLAGLLDVVACADAGRQDVVNALRADYAMVLKSDSYQANLSTEKAQAFYGSLQSAIQQTGQCAAI